MTFVDCILVGLALTASTLLVSGVFLPGWSEDAVSTLDRGVVIRYVGFWEQCDYRAGVLQLTDRFDFLRAVEVMISVGLFLLLVSCIILASYECVSAERQRRVKIIMGVAAISAGLFILIGTIVFAAKINATFDVCVGLAFISAVLAIIAAVLAFCSRTKVIQPI